MAAFLPWPKGWREASSVGPTGLDTHFCNLSTYPRATLWEKNFVKQINAVIFLKAVLVVETMQESLSNFEEKDCSVILGNKQIHL